MSIFRFSNAGGFGTYQRYNDFLAGNPTTPVYVDNGAMFPLGEFTLAAAQANVEFTNIPSTYTHLQIRGIIRGTNGSTGADSALITFNSDTASNYAIHRLQGNGASVTADAFTGIADVSVASLPRSGNTSNSFGAFVIDILDYKNTNKFKTMRALNGWDANGSGSVWFQSGLWRSTSAITTVRMAAGGSGNTFAANSQFALYGVL
jgi:hypothetical protein